ncbi:MAG TPA: ABC transporter ATP-binding protein [Rhodopila sp.]|jgi:NitT/TauT family transport system ATP-binding protein|nr:ABC transporter ATP-binding protein [Rhodopila sp.]
MTRPLIELEHIARRFPSQSGREPFTAVRDIDLAVDEGEFVAVVGPSGCGKSTLLNMISGLDAPTEGLVRIDGEQVRGSVRHDVGYLFQKDALLPWKTVQANVELPLVFRRLPGDHAALARDWLARVGLSGFERNFPHQLSGGMRKRVALAATFVYGPRILLMDEPFSALDVQTRNLMENELLELWRQNRKTVLFVTHDLEEAIALADRVVVLTSNPGRVKKQFQIDLGRPRNVNEIRFEERFRALHEEIWEALREEVARSYAAQRAHG